MCYCNDHRHLAPEENQAEEESEDDLMRYLCVACQLVHVDDNTVLCEKCDRGWHQACHQPVITPDQVNKEDKWYCSECRS